MYVCMYVGGLPVIKSPGHLSLPPNEEVSKVVDIDKQNFVTFAVVEIL